MTIEGLDLKARRDVRDVIDVLEIFTPRGPSTPTAAQAPAPAQPAPPPSSTGRRTLFPVIQALAGGFEQIHVERITLAPSTATLVDEAAKPRTTLALTKLQARIDDFTWPVRGPATLALSTAGWRDA